MNKEEYLKTLAHKLRRLPKEDYDTAMEYFVEYFAEAGPEQEQQAIEDLGTPEEAANTLIMNLAEKNVKEPPKTVKGGFHAVWIGILGICAAPIALPLALAVVAVVFAVVVSVLAVLFALFVSAVCLAAAGIVGIIGGVICLVHTFADGIATIGLGFFASGAGILFVYGSFCLCRWFLKKISQSLGTLTKGGRNHENNH